MGSSLPRRAARPDHWKTSIYGNGDLSRGDSSPSREAAQDILGRQDEAPPDLPQAPRTHRQPGRRDSQEPPSGPRPGASPSKPASTPPPAHPRSPALRPGRRRPQRLPCPPAGRVNSPPSSRLHGRRTCDAARSAGVAQR